MGFKPVPAGQGKLIGEGLYGKVYLLPNSPGKVLKVAFRDATATYIEWCYLMHQQWSVDSPEMKGLPEVFDFGWADKDHWWCVMAEYEFTYSENLARAGRDVWIRPAADPGVVAAIRRIERALGYDMVNDVHGGNVMWSERRKQWIVTDPSSAGPTGASTDELRSKVPRREPPTPVWKMTPESLRRFMGKLDDHLMAVAQARMDGYMKRD